MAEQTAMISVFAELKEIAESGIRLDTSLFYTYPPVPEHTFQFSQEQYHFITGDMRPDIPYINAAACLASVRRCLGKLQSPSVKVGSENIVVGGVADSVSQPGGTPLSCRTVFTNGPSSEM